MTCGTRQDGCYFALPTQNNAQADCVLNCKWASCAVICTFCKITCIGDKLSRGVERLSQGEKQRVAICRALLPSPQLVLADEATGNLDPRNKGHILDLLFDVVQSHKSTLLAVTHDHELLPRFDRIVDFNDFLSVDLA